MQCFIFNDGSYQTINVSVSYQRQVKHFSLSNIIISDVMHSNIITLTHPGPLRFHCQCACLFDLYACVHVNFTLSRQFNNRHDLDRQLIQYMHRLTFCHALLHVMWRYVFFLCSFKVTSTDCFWPFIHYCSLSDSLRELLRSSFSCWFACQHRMPSFWM